MNKLIAAIILVLAVGATGLLLSRTINGSLSPGREAVPAPIDEVDVRMLESYPVRYMLYVKAGLPSGCAERYKHEVMRSADAVTVTVLNWMPAGNPICTMIYGSYELNVDLGTDFRSGTSYTVRVNDKTTTFTAQ